MVDWPLVLIVLIAVVVLGGLLGLAAWWYLPPADLPGPAGARVTAASEPSGAVMPTAGADGHLSPLEMARAAVGRAGEFHTEDDDWADQLHELNQLGKFGDLTRPVAHLTHYEVEALIRTLAVPEWVPDRYRMLRRVAA